MFSLITGTITSSIDIFKDINCIQIGCTICRGGTLDIQNIQLNYCIEQ